MYSWIIHEINTSIYILKVLRIRDTYKIFKYFRSKDHHGGQWSIYLRLVHGSPPLWIDESRIYGVEILEWRYRCLLENNLHWAWPTWELHRCLLTHQWSSRCCSGVSDPLTYGVIGYHSEATEFDCTFSWSLVIQVFAIYVSFNRFRFTVWNKMPLDEIYQS